MMALLLGLVAALSWGIHDVTVRRISQTAPLMATLLGVLLVGAVFQTIVLSATGGFPALPRTAILYSVLAGFAFTLAGASLYGAFQRGPVRIVAPIIGSFPILTLAVAAWRGTPVSPLEWIAVLAVVLGITVVAVCANETEESYPPLGRTIALSLLASVGFFATFALGQEAARIADALPSILVTRLAAVAVLLPIMIVMGLPLLPGRSAWVFVAVMGVLDGIALMCVLIAGDMPSAEYAVVASSIFGLVTVVLARIFLGETMTRAQWLGCLVTFAAIGYLALQSGGAH